MSLWDMPPTCEAYSATNPNALTGYGYCGTTPTLRLLAYDLATPQLHVCYSSPVCTAHAQELAAHWRRHGVRTRANARPRRVLTGTTAWERHAIGYAEALMPELPGMPAPRWRSDPPTRRAPLDVCRAVRLADGPGADARLDVWPSDRSGWGKVRREMVCRLALAFDCHATADHRIGGIGADRLNLCVWGPLPQINALTMSLPSLLAVAERDAAHVVRTYGAWLRRTTPTDLTPGEAASMRRTWRTQFLTNWCDRWAERLRWAQDGRWAKDGELQPGRAHTPQLHDKTFEPKAAARHRADGYWIGMQDIHDCVAQRVRERAQHRARADTEQGRTPAPPPTDEQLSGPVITNQVIMPPRPAREPRVFPAPEEGHVPVTEPLWIQPSAPPAPPAPPKEPEFQGRPLLDVLADFVVQ